ncbi:MAG: YigZ family protein [Rikenellaceae bacterium]|nr:YigZ family protein [Rikenellaceae bacterium]
MACPENIAEKDRYLTIEGPAEAGFRDKGSRFMAWAYPVCSEDEIREIVDFLRKKYYDATHICYAWRLGAEGEKYRANDDGEPSGTAGKPILGQMLSRNITNVLVAVVRYFGGTKLGVPGLINAYRVSAAEVLDKCTVVERTVDSVVTAEFSYLGMNEVMRVVKEMNPVVVSQDFDNLCRITLRIRQSLGETLRSKLSKIEGVSLKE